MNKILVFTEEQAKRTRYIINTILGQFHDFEMQFTSDKDVFNASELPKFSYLENPDKETPNVFNGQTIETDNIFKTTYLNIETDGFWKMMHIQSDIFAFCFFVISRAEEYNTDEKDEHGRFPYKCSILSADTKPLVPIVDVISEELLKWLQKFYPQLQKPQKKPETILTFDIDIAYALKAKPFVRQLGAIGKDVIAFQMKNLSDRFAVLKSRKTDPFDVYDELEKLASEMNFPMIFFFQMRSGGKYDKAANVKSNEFVQLVKRLSEFATIGIHPSYSGGQDAREIVKEKQILENITGKAVTHSRHHFLRFFMPHTARQLVSAGITHDFTMGYADTHAWRAGTSKPFQMFDIESNEVLPLTIFPISIMDGTLLEHLHLSADEAAVKIADIITVTRRHQGVFIPLWHNETISNYGKWKGWKEKVFYAMIQHLEQQNITTDS